MNHGRLQWFTLDELDTEQQAYYDRLLNSPRKRDTIVDAEGRLLGPFNSRLLDPAVAIAIQDLATVLRFQTPLSDRVREIAILEVARSERCNFEWTAHAAVAAAGGMTQDELSALRIGADATTLSAEEHMVRRVAQSLIASRDLDDDLYAAATEVLDLRTIFDVISLVGHYQHTALALRVWRVPLREGMVPVFSDEDVAES